MTIAASVKEVEALAFNGCNALADVYYAGTEASWKAVFIDYANYDLRDAKIRYDHASAAVGVVRLGGNTRYETSVLVVEEFFSNPEAIVVAYAQNFPDGLSGSGLVSDKTVRNLFALAAGDTIKLIK